MKLNPGSTATRAVHAGAQPPRSVTVPKSAPIYASSVFSFDSLAQLDDVYSGNAPGYVYSRMKNPGIDLLEEAVQTLEDGAAAVAIGSGMAAITLSILAQVSAGDHVVAAGVLYGGTYDFLRNELPRRGVSTTFVVANDLDAVQAAMRPHTRVVYCETISNPLMTVADLSALAGIAHRGGARLVVDNTFATPVLCKPLGFGADVSVHSGTKYLNGHSDVTGGVAITADRVLGDSIRSLAGTYGPVLSPFEAWLMLRGIRTLDLRVGKCSENALKLARFLSRHPKVTAVHYPGLETSPDRKMAERYLDTARGFGGMLSFEVRGGLDGARSLIDALDLVKLVPSLADVSTTVSHPGKTSHRDIPVAEREAYGVGDGLIRVSAGIEDYRDVEDDFAKALDKVK